jgi:hypothetical protein
MASRDAREKRARIRGDRGIDETGKMAIYDAPEW